MKHHLIGFLIGAAILCLSPKAQAQKIGEIRKKAQEQSTKRSSSDSNSSRKSRSGSSDYSSGSGAGEFINLLIDLFSRRPRTPEELALRAENKAIRAENRAIRRDARAQKRADGILRAQSSFELAYHVGLVPSDYVSHRFRARARVGVISTDLRYSGLTEQRLREKDRFNTLDWQILQVHLSLLSQVGFRLGAGFMREYEADQVYPEVAGAFDFRFLQQRFRFMPELRYAWDSRVSEGNSETVRVEFNSQFSYALVDTKPVRLYGGFNLKYARYFDSVDLWTLGLGLNLLFH